jgi:hypothetical protein
MELPKDERRKEWIKRYKKGVARFVEKEDKKGES